jgi:hypothetical protein
MYQAALITQTENKQMVTLRRLKDQNTVEILRAHRSHLRSVRAMAASHQFDAPTSSSRPSSASATREAKTSSSTYFTSQSAGFDRKEPLSSDGKHPSLPQFPMTTASDHQLSMQIDALQQLADRVKKQFQSLPTPTNRTVVRRPTVTSSTTATSSSSSSQPLAAVPLSASTSSSIPAAGTQYGHSTSLHDASRIRASMLPSSHSDANTSMPRNRSPLLSAAGSSMTAPNAATLAANVIANTMGNNYNRHNNGSMTERIPRPPSRPKLPSNNNNISNGSGYTPQPPSVARPASAKTKFDMSHYTSNA